MTKKVNKKTDLGVTRLVGIGASAGGLEALRDLMESLPDSQELSYVIAQHVSPTHVSLLTSLLAPKTMLQVHNVEDNQIPEPGRVYITPPNTDIILKDGRLHLTLPTQTVGPKPSVNYFFNSLAQELGEHAIGIILSGTGTDGASGLRAIKAAGGITIAQEPDSAKYDGMPKAAIHTGSVDLILKPSMIGHALDRLISDHQELDVVLDESLDADEYTKISNIVRLTTAFRLSDYKSNTVRRRIARRMSIVGKNTLSDYIELLRSNKDEAHALVRDTFISVTSFFRDSEAFLALEHTISELVKNQTDRNIIRCWIPGCATGEEAYSIAMLFEEALREQNRSDLQFVIFASDLDDDALAHARDAVYAANELENVPKVIRDRYTESIGGYYRIQKSIRNRLVFARQNVIEDPPFGRLDLISCRNLLIYLNPPIQKKVFQIFHYSLNRNGRLFLGRSESAEGHKELFSVIESRCRIYQRVDGIAHYSLPISQGLGAVSPRLAKQHETNGLTTNTDIVSMKTLELLADLYAPASLVINEADIILQFQGNLKPFLSFPSGRAEMYLFDMVSDVVRAELRALVYRCRRDLTLVRGGQWNLNIDSIEQVVTPAVCPLEAGQRNLLLISFTVAPKAAETQNPSRMIAQEQDNLIISELEQELANTRSHLNIVVEELETSNEELQSLNEELQSTNEELQSTNEEMQTANEELQSTNEELLTLNEEMQVKSSELEKIVDDLNNVKESLPSPLLVVDLHLQITQANSACGYIAHFDFPLEKYSLKSVDWKINVPKLVTTVRGVIKTGIPHQQTLQSEKGIAYRLSIMPYKTQQGMIEGVVLMFTDVTVEETSKEQLRLSHERFDLAVLGSSDGLWDWEVNTSTPYFSPRFKQILGYQDKELKSDFNDWLDRLHSEDKEATLSALNATLSKDEPYDIEYRLRIKSGEYVWVRARGKVVARDSENKALRMSGAITDITNAKLIEAGLNSAMNKLQLATTAADIGIWTWDLTDNTLIWDERLHSLYQVPEELKLSRIDYAFWQSRCHPEDLQKTELALNIAMQGGEAFDVQFRVVLPDGGIRYIQSSAVVEFDHIGKPIRFVGINRDLTAQKKNEQMIRESEARVSRLIDLMPETILLVDHRGCIQRANQSAQLILGYEPTFLIGKSVEMLMPEAMRASHVGYREGYQNDPKVRSMGTSRDDLFALHKDGRHIPIEVGLAPFMEDGHAMTIVSIADITSRKISEEELRLSAKVIDNTLDAIAVTEANGTFVKVNQAFEKLFGYSSSELIGHKKEILRSGRHPPEFYVELWKKARETGGWQGEVWMRHKNESLIPIWVSVSAIRNWQGQIDRHIFTMYDISEQKISQERINFLAHYDPLTGLPNRTLLMDRFEHALLQASRNKSYLSLLYLDVDNFKQVNDTYGHPVGDDLLRGVAERLRKATRVSDTIGRLSGDEFLVLISDSKNAMDVQDVAKNILSVMATPFHLDLGEVYVSVSIGIATYPADGEAKDVLLKNADLAMYKSKDLGRNQYHFFNAKMSEFAKENMAMQNDLRQVFDLDSLEIFYQPILDVATRRCVGAEALLRWHHQDKGWVPPAKFISVAEESSLIHVIGSWVLRKSCEQMKAWLNTGLNLEFMSVNVSGKQLHYSNFLKEAKETLVLTGVIPQSITLEMTESFVMRESEGSEERLKALRDLGFKIAIDDFGTGYSSLTYLKRLPVNKLKLDQSFVRDVPDDANGVAIARAILNLGKAVGLPVIAEGVENECQHNFLLSEGCKYSQGYLYSQPVPADEFVRFYTKNRG